MGNSHSLNSGSQPDSASVCSGESDTKFSSSAEPECSSASNVKPQPKPASGEELEPTSINCGEPEREIFRNIPPELLARSGVPQNAFDNALASIAIASNAFHTKVKDAIGIAIEHLKRMDPKALVLALAQWIPKNPGKAAMIAGAILVPVLCAVLAPPLLALVGFSAAGPVAGSIAAAIQACIGNVASGSLFAILQSADMGGYGAAIVSGVTWGISSLVCWGATLFTFKRMATTIPKLKTDSSSRRTRRLRQKTLAAYAEVKNSG